MATLVDRARGSALTLTAAIALSACGVGQPPNLGDALNAGVPDTGVQGCKVTADTARPMLVEWPAVEKASLQGSASGGVVVVRYDGCRLKQLPGCRLPGEYDFVETSRAQDGFVVRDQTELFAKLPLGAVGLAAEIKQGKQLELSYVAVGTRTANVGGIDHGSLAGGCESATHIVRTMVVGAYALASQAMISGGAGVEVGSAGAGGSHSKQTEIVRKDGDLDSCLDVETPATDKRCQAIVQLILEPIADAARPAEGGGEPAKSATGNEVVPSAATLTADQASATTAPASAGEEASTGPLPAGAVARYRARMSEADHYATKGGRLRTSALIVRQDRYNFHVAQTRDDDDQTDPVFGSKTKRATLQRLLKAWIPEHVDRSIVEGTPLVEVTVWHDRAQVRIVTD